MSSNSEAADPLRRVIRGLAAAGGGHPAPEAIQDYREGRCGPDAEEEIREHLAGCPDCATDLLELEALFQGEPRPGAEMSAAEVAAAWARQRARWGANTAAVPAIGPSGRRRETRHRRFSTSTVSLGLAAAVLALVTLMQWQRIAQLEAPQVNPPMLLLAPKGSVREATPGIQTLRFSADGQSAWLVLHTEAELRDVGYDLEVIGPGGAVVLRVAGVRSSDAGTFRLEVSRRALPAGRNRIVLYGRGGDARRALEEYEIEVVSGSVE